IYAGGIPPHTLRDGTLHAQIEKVCAKVRVLIDGGAVVNFGDLIRKEPSGGYRWQMILAGGLDWTVAPARKKSKPKDDFIERKLKEREEARAKRAREAGGGLSAGPEPHAGLPG